MTDQTQNPDMQAALLALLSQAQQQQPVAAGGWQPQQPAQLPITGISIPVKIDTPLGSVRVDLHLPAECGANPQAILSAIQALANAGYPVDAWQRKESGWGGGSGSGDGGGWGNRSNGYSNRGGSGGGGYGGRRW